MKMKKLYSVVIALLIAMFGFVNTTKAAAVTYTLAAAANPTVLGNWKANNLAAIPQVPTSFVNAGVGNTWTFLFDKAAIFTMAANWTLGGGTGTIKLNVGNGVVAATLDDGGNILAATCNVTVNKISTLIISNAAGSVSNLLPNFTNSMVKYTSNGGTQFVLPATYQNIQINGTSQMLLSGGGITVNKTLTIAAGAELTLNAQVLGFATASANLAGTGMIIGDSTASIAINGSAASFGTLTFVAGREKLNGLTIAASAAAPVIMGSDITIIDDGNAVNPMFDYQTGNLKLNGHTLNIDSSALTISFPFLVTDGVITGSSSSKMNISCQAAGLVGGTLWMDQTSAASKSLSTLVYNDRSASQTLTLGNTLNIIDSIIPTSGIIDGGGNLTLLADQVTIGKVGRIGTVGGSIIGNIVSQIYHSPTTNNTDWRLLTVPGASGVPFSSWESQFPMTCPTCPTTMVYGNPFSSISTYDETTGTYPDINYPSTLTPGVGYWVYLGSSLPGTTSNPFLVTNTGNAVTGTVPVTLTNAGPAGFQGYNLIGNPYASPVSWAKLLNTNDPTATLMNQGWYTYSPAFGDNAVYIGGLSTPAYVHGGQGIDDVIPAGMGFYVQETAGASMTFNFTEGCKTNGSNEVLLKQTNPNNTQSSMTFFRMQMSAAGAMNEAVVRFDANATMGFDNRYDFLDQAPGVVGLIQISTISLGKAYTVNTLPDLTQNYSIPVLITSGTTGPFQFTAVDLQNMPAGVCIKLHDNYTSTDYDVRSGPFSLTVNDTETVARYRLNITVSPLSITTNAVQTNCANSNTGYIAADGNNAGPWNYTWRNGSGTIVKTSLNKASSDTLLNLNNGVYSVDVNTVGFCDNATQTFTLTAPAATTSAFSVSSNTVIVNNNLTFTDNSTNANAWFWTYGDGNTSNMQNPIYAYTTPGVYTVTLSSINTACNYTVTSTKVITVLGTTGVSTVANGETIVSKDQNGTFIKFNYGSLSKISINVYNELGQMLLVQDNISVSNDKIYINLDNAKGQMVFVSITNTEKNTQVTKKLFID